jgi:hypothetical protein
MSIHPLFLNQISGIDFLIETPQYLDSVTGEHSFNDKWVVSGILGALNDKRVFVRPDNIALSAHLGTWMLLQRYMIPEA